MPSSPSVVVIGGVALEIDPQSISTSRTNGSARYQSNDANVNVLLIGNAPDGSVTISGNYLPEASVEQLMLLANQKSPVTCTHAPGSYWIKSVSATPVVGGVGWDYIPPTIGNPNPTQQVYYNYTITLQEV